MKTRILKASICVALVFATFAISVPINLSAASEPSTWAIEWMDKADSIGLVPTGFDLDYQKAITRSEFCYLAVQFMEVHLKQPLSGIMSENGMTISLEDKPFSDTNDMVIIAANKLGIVAGNGDGTFAPNDTLTREQGATMLSNLAKTLHMDVSAPQATGFADYGAISQWAKAPVDFCFGKDIMVGDGANFNPKGSYTQEQSLITFCKFFEGDAKKPSPDAPHPKKVGISLPTISLQRWEQDGNLMKALFEAAGYEVDLQYGGENEINVQVSQIEKIIADGCDALIIAPIDGESMKEALAPAKSKGIPVIAYDRLIMGTDAVTHYVTFNSWRIGELQGEFIRDALKLDSEPGPFNIEFFTGDFNDKYTDFFYGGAMSILQPYLNSGKLKCLSGQIEKLTVSTADWRPDNAQARMGSLIAAYDYGSTKTKLDAVMCSNDTTAQGVTNALAIAGYTKGNFPVITGQDCDIVSCKNIIAGAQSMSVLKDTRTIAEQAATMVCAYFSGQRIPVNDNKTYDNNAGIVPSYLCDPVVVTADNLREFLIDSGYYSESELS